MTGMQRLFRSSLQRSNLKTTLQRFYVIMNGNIIHDEKSQLFFVDLNNDGGRAVLEYEKTDEKTLDFYHTGVPTTHRGQGIAKHLVKAGFDFVFVNNLKVKPTCSYVQKYVNENFKNAEIKKFITQ